ncbi:hypothetical protein DEU56DRAFT_786252 [Suillus clintonianus]|uniref:uncharacterized protein n=1 Tax=Suillus clintonianus TaxID=1904413 RepID=UPI001B872485|nr:uncharacterized protein DEU56DRAFT_786252 [Suillus clintonianus]KAG2146759.1 hypothetical protein DEU56DRAFT_786252 [Suillus clintonianus]
MWRSLGRPCSAVPLAIKLRGVSCLTSMRLWGSVELHWSSVPPVVLIGPHISSTLPTVSKRDLSSRASCMTSLHWSFVAY